MVNYAFLAILGSEVFTCSEFRVSTSTVDEFDSEVSVQSTLVLLAILAKKNLPVQVQSDCAGHMTQPQISRFRVHFVPT